MPEQLIKAREEFFRSCGIYFDVMELDPEKAAQGFELCSELLEQRLLNFELDLENERIAA